MHCHSEGQKGRNSLPEEFPPRGGRKEDIQPPFEVGVSGAPNQRKSFKKSSSYLRKNGKRSASSGNGTSNQSNMSPTQRNLKGRRKQLDNMNPNEAHGTVKYPSKKSSTYINDKKTKKFTSNQNVGSPQTSVSEKEDSLELRTPKKIYEVQATSKARYRTRARSNSPLPSLKRKHDSETEREVKEKIQKKKRKLIDHEDNSPFDD